MRISRTSLAGVTLALCLGSSSLFAQTETEAPAVTPVQVEDLKQDDSTKLTDVSPATDSSDADAQTDTQAKPSVAASSDTADPKAVEPQQNVVPTETVKPKSAAQQSPKPAVVPKKQGRFALTFDDLKFDKEKDEAFNRKLLTSKITSYHGGKVKIRGYIRPNYKQSGLTKFIFVRDNKECCFGPQAAIFDNILVRLEKGESTNYTVRPITLEGDFVLKEYYGDNGKVWSLYRMYNAEVK